MVDTVAKLPDLTDKTMTKVFIDAYKAAPQEYKKIPLGVIPSSSSYEKYSTVSTIEELPEFTGGSIEEVDVEQLYDKTITPKEFAGVRKIQRKLFDDNMWKPILDAVKSLGHAARRGKDKNIYQIFNEATSTTNFSGGDGVALVSTSHPYSPTNASVQSNYSISALSSTTLAAARVAMTLIKNAKGEPAGVEGKLLMVPVNLDDTAAELTKSPAKPDATYSSGVTNVLGNIGYVSSVRLTDTNNWFLLDPMLAKETLLLINRIPLEFAATDDFMTMQKWYRAYERYNLGFIDWRFCYGAIVA